jgi:hypothetical protein
MAGWGEILGGRLLKVWGGQGVYDNSQPTYRLLLGYVVCEK